MHLVLIPGMGAGRLVPKINCVAADLLIGLLKISRAL